jgi:hypothetical protein
MDVNELVRLADPLRDVDIATPDIEVIFEKASGLGLGPRPRSVRPRLAWAWLATLLILVAALVWGFAPTSQRQPTTQTGNANYGKALDLIDFLNQKDGVALYNPVEHPLGPISSSALLVVTRNAGVTWTPLGPPPTSQLGGGSSWFDWQMAFITTQVGYIGDYPAGLLFTRDGGRTWTRVQQGDVIGLATTGDHVWTAVARCDAGCLTEGVQIESWNDEGTSDGTLATIPHAFPYGVFPGDTQFQGGGEMLTGPADTGCFVALFNGATPPEPSGYVFATSDAWKKWTSFPIGVPGSPAANSGLSQSGDILWSVLEAAEPNVTIHRLSGEVVSSEDAAPPGTIESLVARSSSRAFALTTDGLFVTADGAKTWRYVSGPSTGASTVPTGSLVFVGQSAWMSVPGWGLWRTTDGGSTWNKVAGT